jgi:prepilin-type N-terminal cleavage/methylation domain-containing protein
MHRKANLGFTLIEVMVSVALVATGFVSLLVLQRQNVAAHGTIQRYTMATMIAEDRLERMILRAQGFEQLEEYNRDLEDNYPDFEVNAEVSDVGPEALPVVMLLPEGLTLVRITVVVSWMEGKRAREYKLEHFVTQKLL